MAPDDLPVQSFVTAYGEGGFKISGAAYSGSVIITPESVLPWDVAAFDDLQSLDIDALTGLIGTIDVLLVGTGPDPKFLPPSSYKVLADGKTSVDFMATGPACRTFNVLQSDGRNVAAALICVP